MIISAKVHNFHHKTAPDDAIYIGRGSPYGNPFAIGIHGNREEVIKKYEERILPKLNLTPLIGYDLICYCKPAKCHGDSILKKLEEMKNDDGTSRKAKEL